MALNSYLKHNQQAGAVTGFTGAAPQQVSGASLSMVAKRVAVGTLSATVYAKATTNTLTVTAKWQVSRDAGSTWYDAVVPQNPANVALATGTGSADTVTKAIAAPDSVYGFPLVRCVAVSGVGVGGGADVDEASIAYNYRQEA